MATAPVIPPFPESIEDPKKLAALGHVLGCTPAMSREVLRGRGAEEALWERIEALERMVSSLTTLVVSKNT